MKEQTTFDADTFSARTGAPTTQIEYLVRAGILEPAVPASRRGVSRKYNVRNLFEAAVAIELINAGVLAKDVRKAVAEAKPTAALLVLFRMAGRLDQPVTPQLVPYVRNVRGELVPEDFGTTADAGYTIIAAVSIGFIARRIEELFPGELA